jgi:putative nucleotidyltransferase with HDIG domain
MEALIQVMESTIAARDPYTVSHQQRVTQIACAIAAEMSLPSERIRQLRLAATLHDVGKVAIPTELLARPGKLSPMEFDLIKTHPQVGYNILQPIKFPGNTAEIILQHHERLNGSGYPRNLREPEILLEAKILGVADVMEAMCSHRPYRPALSPDAALTELSQNKGILYDAAAVDACLKLYGEMAMVSNPSTPGSFPKATPISQSLALVGDFGQPHINFAQLSIIPKAEKCPSWNWPRLFSKDHPGWVHIGRVAIVGLMLGLFSRGS